MRAAPSNFDEQQLKQAVDYAHAQGVKLYITCNTLPRDNIHLGVFLPSNNIPIGKVARIHRDWHLD